MAISLTNDQLATLMRVAAPLSPDKRDMLLQRIGAEQAVRHGIRRPNDAELEYVAQAALKGFANVILSAVGYNLRLVLAWLRMILRVVLLALLQIFAIQPALKPAS